MVTLTATADTHWEFGGWSGDWSGLTTPVTLTMDAPKTVTATFTLKQYALVTATVGNGSLAVEPAGGLYDALTVVTLTATADSPHNVFTGWSGDVGGTTNPVTLTMDAAKTVTATFALKQYALVTATVGNGSLAVEPAGGVYEAGSRRDADGHARFGVGLRRLERRLERRDQSGDADDGRVTRRRNGHIHHQAVQPGCQHGRQRRGRPAAGRWPL